MESAGQKFRSGDLVILFKSGTYPPKPQHIIILSGSNSPRRGIVSALPSGILLSPSDAFVTALLLILDDSKGI